MNVGANRLPEWGVAKETLAIWSRVVTSAMSDATGSFRPFLKLRLGTADVRR
jgi:hypothetical protein